MTREVEMVGRNNKTVERILSLKHKKNAIILAHNYQPGEIQDIADFVGDSLDLSQQAAETQADIIVFCGVHFMAETASILCPDKKILLPDANAGCPMANMITAESLREKKKEYPNAIVICYVNSSADVKAESDVCCTSANAINVVQKLADSRKIIFVPDQYLGHYVSTKTNKNLILWPGFCPTHMRIQPQGIAKLKQNYPEAKVIIHPECRPEVIALADEVLSTSGMIKFAQKTQVRDIVVGTEIGIIYRLKKENPGKRFIPASKQAVCPNMKRITLEKVIGALEELSPEIVVPREISLKARAAVDKMLEIGRSD